MNADEHPECETCEGARFVYLNARKGHGAPEPSEETMVCPDCRGTGLAPERP